MVLLITGLALFLGLHSVRIFMPQWREQRIAALGERRWKGIYTAVSLASFVLLVYGYGQARDQANILYQPLSDLYLPAVLLLTLAMMFLMAFNLGPGHIKQKLRHPFLLSIILWSTAHLWMNGDTASVILFGSFLVWSIVDLRSALSRPKVDQPEPVLRNDIIAIVSGLVIVALFFWKVHQWLFGVAPII